MEFRFTPSLQCWPRKPMFKTYPNVAPEPSMYLPRVRITPLGPAPYWKIVTVPIGG